jgi:hypothetical protein
MANQGSAVGNETHLEDGWFDVEAYSTRGRWEGPDRNDDGLEGFTTLKGAIECANSPQFEDFYQVVVSAYGKHKDHEAGERVYWRFHRSLNTKCNERAVAAGEAAVVAHTQNLGIVGGQSVQLWHALASLLEWSAANGIDFDEALEDVRREIKRGDVDSPAAALEMADAACHAGSKVAAM